MGIAIRSERRVLKILLDAGLNVTPSALNELKKRNLDEIREIISRISSQRQEVAVITLDLLASEIHRKESFDKPREVRCEVVFEAQAEKVDGRPEDFLRYMRSRFDKLTSILQRKIGHETPKIISVRRMKPRETVDIIGMVREKRSTRGGSYVLILEDVSGTVPCFVDVKNRRLVSKLDRVVMDSVIWVRGSVTNNGGIGVKNIVLPDVNGRERRGVDARIVFISDIHVGSKYFLEDSFLSFVEWLNGESNARYLVLCGDLVDGVGIYPDQEEELELRSLREQFERASELLSKISRDVEIIYIPGNHEPVRQAEPQPPIGEDFLRVLRKSGRSIRTSTNPCMISVDGIKILLYHGRSLNSIFKYVPGLQPVTPETMVEAMRTLLQLRHLAPVYGEMPIAPEREDKLVIEDVPDVVCMGHVHVYGIGEHHGIKVINPGTFQDETPYIERMGIRVTPGTAVLMDLSDMSAELKRFS